MRFAIIGPAQSGKTTFAGYLADILGTGHTDLSGWIIEVETIRQRRMGEISPKSPAQLLDEWDYDRGRPTRKYLIALGDAVCELRPSFLIERAFEKAPIIAGVRRIEEFETLPEDVITVYIDRADAPDIQDTFDIPLELTQWVIENNGTLEELREKAEDLVRDSAHWAVDSDNPVD